MPTYTGTDAAEQLFGTSIDDVIHGAGGDDRIWGREGADLLYGDAGDDILRGEGGVDVLYGGIGNDTLIFGAGDTAYGEDGDDYFEADYTNVTGATLDGGAGYDRVDLNNSGGDFIVYLDDAVGAGLRIRNVESINVGNRGTTVYGGSRDDTIVSGPYNSWTVNFHGGGGDDVLTGQMGNDMLYGDAGDDIIGGGTGSNTLDGGAGFDLADYSMLGGSTIDLGLTVRQWTGNNNDEILNFEGAIGGTGRDDFFGTDGANTLIGGGGDDLLEGGGGDDLLVGGAGNDMATYRRASSGVTVSLGEGSHSTGAAGTDTFESIEGLTGSAFNDVLTGDDGNNIFVGGAGDDRIEGGAGEDTAYFTTNYAAPTYTYDGLQVIVTGDATGRDVLTGVEVLVFNGSTVRVSDLAIVRTGTAAGETMNGGSASDTLRGAGGNDIIFGNGGFDHLYGDDGDDQITGGAQTDQLDGGAGNDVLDGGAGSDTMVGGAGDDTFYADDQRDIAFEGVGGGIDTIITTVSLFPMGENIENLVLAGSADINAYGNSHDNRITGNDGANRLGGGQGDDILVGGRGNDTYIVLTENGEFDTIVELAGEGIDDVLAFSDYDLIGTEVENIALSDDYGNNITGNHLGNVMTGNRRANTVEGLGGDDLLRGEAGNDILNGGAGDDIIMGGAGSDALNGGSGIDLADYSVANAGVNVNLTTGLASSDGLGGSDTLTGIENITGTLYADTLTGDGAANHLIGGRGNDTLGGGEGDDILVGGVGFDVLSGGGGLDTVDYSGAASGMRAQLNTGASSNDGDGGTDTFSGIENLTGSAFNDVLIGDAGANVLRGGLGADTLIGLAGNDVIHGGAGALNTLSGGLGNDLYVLEAADSIVESVGEGIDTVDARINTYILANNVENLIFGGTGDFAGTGNDLANVITGGAGADVLRGRGGVDTLNGGAGIDTADYGLAAAGVMVRLDLQRATRDGDGATDNFSSIENAIGSNFNDVLYGDGANNVLMGAGGSDVLAGFGGDDILMGGSGGMNNQLFGGTGDDWYILDAFDSCIEYAGEGVDTVEARVGSYTLGAHLENLLYTGPGKFVGAGNALNNVITGGELNDMLRGGGGNDRLFGGGGRDEVQLRGAKAQYTVTAEGAGWRIVDSVAGRDGSTYVESVEVLRFLTGNTTTVLVPAAPAASVKDDPALVSPLAGDGADAFVLPALPDEEPPVLPGLEAPKFADAPLVLPDVSDPSDESEEPGEPPAPSEVGETRHRIGLEARLSGPDDWMPTLNDEDASPAVTPAPGRDDPFDASGKGLDGPQILPGSDLPSLFSDLLPLSPPDQDGMLTLDPQGGLPARDGRHDDWM